jgi:bacillaene synthase trans-acting acyltransferase
MSFYPDPGSIVFLILIIFLGHLGGKMSKRIIFMLSGQGSQYYGMGKELYFQNPIFRSWMTKLNDILYQSSRFSVIDELYNANNTGKIFDQLSYTHPAIFMVEYSLVRVLIENGLEPDCILGTSLGEFIAAAVAGVVSLEEALQLILKQVELVSNLCQAGRMTAIIHNPDFYYQSPVLNLHSELAAVNYSSHFVISGFTKELLTIEDYLKTKEIIFQSLPVKYGFHSKNINPIEGRYKELLSAFKLNKPVIPFISCMRGDFTEVLSQEHLWDVIRRPILFEKTIAKLEGSHENIYIDLSPFGTLTNFIKQNLVKDSLSQYYSIMSPFHQDVKNLKAIGDIFNRKAVK